jgi:hypothetical protein
LKLGKSDDDWYNWPNLSPQCEAGEALLHLVEKLEVNGPKGELITDLNNVLEDMRERYEQELEEQRKISRTQSRNWLRLSRKRNKPSQRERFVFSMMLSSEK